IKTKTVALVAERIKDVFSAFVDFSVIDGVRLALKDGWLLIRASGTEPLIRVTVEGKTEGTAKELMQKATALIYKQMELN
ncbi:MAG: phosphoglucosamine mutase, partial [Nitrososphaerota archaeon]|nr:phosphoglucosamine mutase [Nitrososphaerota archaeon]